MSNEYEFPRCGAPSCDGTCDTCTDLYRNDNDREEYYDMLGIEHIGGALCPCLTCYEAREVFYGKLAEGLLVEVFDESGSHYEDIFDDDPCLGCTEYRSDDLGTKRCQVPHIRCDRDGGDE